jgi:hypothetical protein
LYYWGYDEVGREPYWAAAPSDSGRVKVAYLLGYYRDAGSDAYICNLPPPLWHSSCEGHNGDSETIILEVYYSVDTSHWILWKAKYSQHTGYGVYSKGLSAYPTKLHFPTHPGAHPRAYVAEGKHANYRSAAECNSGGAFGTDTCGQVNTAARVVVSSAWNVGSSSVPLLDCVVSRDPGYIYYGSGRQECFWANQNFRGWIPTSIGGASSTPYRTRLNDGGF